MGLHQFLSHYDKTQNAYCKAIVLIVFTLYEQGILLKTTIYLQFDERILILALPKLKGLLLS